MHLSFHTFPVATSFGSTAKWTDYRTQLNIYTLLPMFTSHIVAALIHKTAVPRGGNGLSRRERRVVIA